MATVINETDPRAEAFRNLGAGALQSHYTRSDEMAIKNALEKLGQNPTARQVLDAVTSTPTYSPQAKQQALKNFMGVAEFEELQRAAKKKEEMQEQTTNLKKDLADLKAKSEAEKELNDSLTLIDASDIGQDEKEALRNRVKEGKASFEAIKEVLKPNKERIKKEEEEKSKDVTQNAFNELAALIPKVGRTGILTSKLGGDTAKAYANFTSLTGALEALLVEKVNRGALSNKRFEYITETLLPKPYDTQAEIEGKLSGLASILELDPSALGAKKGSDRYVVKADEIPETLMKSAKKYEGKTITAPNGNKYFSDGEKWLKK